MSCDSPAVAIVSSVHCTSHSRRDWPSVVCANGSDDERPIVTGTELDVPQPTLLAAALTIGEVEPLDVIARGKHIGHGSDVFHQTPLRIGLTNHAKEFTQKPVALIGIPEAIRVGVLLAGRATNDAIESAGRNVKILDLGIP